jgi:hypothetical protein
MLNLSGNRLTGTLNLASSLPGLVGLNIGECISTLSLVLWMTSARADNNQVDRLEPTGLMPLLRIIRASGNPIQYLSTVPWPSLRTLYVGTTRLILSQKQNN